MPGRAATVIASQAVITGAFSVAQRVAQVGYLPRLRIAQTPRPDDRADLVPWINWALLVSVQPERGPLLSHQSFYR